MNSNSSMKCHNFSELLRFICLVGKFFVRFLFSIDDMRQIIYWFTILLVISSCVFDKIDAPDVEDIEVDLNVFRMEQKIMSIDTNNVTIGLQYHPH